MSPEEHYEEAERLLTNLPKANEEAKRIGTNGDTLNAALQLILAEAQVHATLAGCFAMMPPPEPEPDPQGMPRVRSWGS